MYFYADQESIERVSGSAAKIVLIGSDFGYGNFGDVAQHLGAISLARHESGSLVVSVLAINALSRHFGASMMRKAYAVDALLFVADTPLSAADQGMLGLRPVRSLRSISCVHLYGGGFLNEMWGEFVLSVVEWLLARLESTVYVVSGQQVSAAFADRVARHVEAHKPKAFGVRDEESLALLRSRGVHCSFSFDDAVEVLSELASTLKLTRGVNGCLIHLNSSDYTGNDGALMEIAAHLQGLAGRAMFSGRFTLAQAYRDAREEVVDTLETVKRLDASLPLDDCRVLSLVPLLLGGSDSPRSGPVEIAAGYSCSYHVALWLQLAGVPCWIRSENPYYVQKRKALGIPDRFEDFFAELPVPDHASHLERRQSWLGELRLAMQSAPDRGPSIAVHRSEEEMSPAAFHYKGEPPLTERLRMAWASVVGLTNDLEQRAREAAAGREAIAALEQRVEAAENEKQRQSEIVRELQGSIDRLSNDLRAGQLVEVELRTRIADAGEEAGRLLAQVMELAGRAAESEGRAHLLDQIARSAKDDALAQHERAATLSERLVALEMESNHLKARLEDGESRSASLLERISALGDENRGLEIRANRAELELSHSVRSNESLQATIADLERRSSELADRLRDADSRILALLARITAIGDENRTLEVRASRAELDHWHAVRGNESLAARVAELEHAIATAHVEHLEARQRGDDLAARLETTAARLSDVGHQARAMRERAECAEQALDESTRTLHGASERLSLILGSRSWRYTRPFRAAARFASTGRFDAAGNVGLFALLAMLARRIGISPRVRASVGAFLGRFRRRH